MQIVGYDAGVDNLEYEPTEGTLGEVEPPAILLANDNTVTRHVLKPGIVLEFSLGERHCAGVVTDDRHTPCPAEVAPECDEHAVEWPCAQCTGQCNKPIQACEEEHAVYLAAFAPAEFKVGVTRLWRLPARLYEQGADRAAHLHTVSDGRIARRIERELANSIPDRVPVEAKINGMHLPVDEEQWNEILEDFATIDTMAFEYDLELSDRPVRETLATGTVLGSKGRVVVLEYNTGVYAVDLGDLVGYELHEGEPDRDLQSSLGAFG